MNVQYGESATLDDKENDLLHQGTKSLQEVLGPSADQVAVEWDRDRDDKGRPRYKLTLSDFAGEVAATFAPDDLASPRRLRSRLLELWGDLLQIRSDRQMRKIMDLVEQLTDLPAESDLPVPK